MKIKALSFILLCMMLFAAAFGNFAAPQIAVCAADAVVNKFDDINVMTDLESATLNGVPFDINDYPFDEQGELQVINFVEYCYTYRAALQMNYGLYIYIYNPAGLNIERDSLSNKIQMAISFYADGNPNYEKVNLKFCNASTGNYAGLFQKYRVDFTPEQFTRLLIRIDENGNQAERRYQLSGVELLTRGESTATEYTIAWTITASGFAAGGYGPDMEAPSTLQVQIEGTEVEELNVHHTYYRYYRNNDLYDQLDTVYFSVDERFFEEYGFLQRIKASWYEYKTKEILVTENQDVFDRILPYLGQHLGDEFNWDINNLLASNFVFDFWGTEWDADWIYNAPADSQWAFGANITDILYLMYYAAEIEEYDPLEDKEVIGGVESNILYQDILNYKTSYENGHLPVKDGEISADLFQDNIDADRITPQGEEQFGKIQKGYSYWDFDYGADILKLTGYDASFANRIKDQGLWDAILHPNKDVPEIGNILPIKELTESDLSGQPEAVSTRLRVNIDDVDDLKAFYAQAEKENKRTILFRFAVSDYYSAPVSIVSGTAGIFDIKNGQAYVAKETVFLDFDIIQLTFMRNDIYHVIPVVSNPIDIVNDLVPPYDMPPDFNIWEFLKTWGLVILAVIIFTPIIIGNLPKIFAIILFPIKWFIGLFKGGG